LWALVRPLGSIDDVVKFATEKSGAVRNNWQY
jgi:hypothetical protein